MVKLLSKQIKSKKTGKEYTAYYLQAGDFTSEIFFANNVPLEKFAMISQILRSYKDGSNA